ncbi:unnamed protein product, partial [Polarella glacialis]
FLATSSSSLDTSVVSGLSGVVKSWNGSKGFGFITCDSLAGDVLFARTEMPQDVKEVRGKFLEGRPCVFDAQQQADGRFKATNLALPYVEGNEKHGYGFITSSSLTEDPKFSPLPAFEQLNGMSRTEFSSANGVQSKTFLWLSAPADGSSDVPQLPPGTSLKAPPRWS